MLGIARRRGTGSLFRAIKCYSTTADNPPFKVAVIGSGPAGFYTAYRLLEKLPGTQIDMYESLPVPYGLARFGVAPDHPEVKNCQDKFNEVAQYPGFQFFGNVAVGKDEETLVALKQNYNSIVFAYGSSEDRQLGVPGEDLPGVFSAREFVGWYNGLPEHSGLNPPLEDAEDVVIIGNGNVALDVARMLLCNLDKIKSTDITEESFEALKKSKVKRVRIVARRGLLQSAFTTKEIRELVKEPGSAMEPLNDEYIESYKPFIPLLGRATKRLTQVLEKAPKENEAKADPITKTWRLDYLQSPEQFYPHPTNSRLLSGTKFGKNTLIQDDITSPATVLSTGEEIIHKSELAFRSIGYKALPLKGMDRLEIPFDERRGVILNDLGRVVGKSERGFGEPLYGLYVAGWVKNGPTGVIATTMRESFEVAETLIEDYYKNRLDTTHKPGFEGVKPVLKSRPVTWNDWLKIEQVENERGASLGKPRSKFTNTAEMLKIIE